MRLIELRDIWVKYRGAADYALKGVDFELEEGEVVGVIGPTGAGKTTLAKVMAGIIPNMGAYDEFRGRALVGGRDTRNSRVGEISRFCSMVFQDYEIQLFRTTVELEVAFGPENLCLPREEIASRVKRALELTGLAGMERRYSFGLSGGQKQRVSIAAMLALRPQVLVLDEATSDLDPLGKREIYDVISNLLREGVLRGLVLIDHRLEKMAQFVDRVVVMNNGEVIRVGDAREVLTDVPLLQGLGLRPPEVAEVYHRLGVIQGPRPLTVEEAVNHFPPVASHLPPSMDEPPSRRPVLSLHDVWFAYEGRKWVVQVDSMVLHEGEMVGLIGQNGSGKSTLAQIMMGILRPQRGRVVLFGEDVTARGVEGRVGKVGYIFQNPDYQIFSPTVREELAYGPRALKLPPDVVTERVTRVAKMLNIEHLLDEDPFFLQKSDRQRVAVASVLTVEPKILLLDEPTTGLSPAETVALMDMVKGLNSLGSTVLVISHDMWVIAKYCPRCILMHDGRIIWDGATRKVFSRYSSLKEYDIDVPQVVELSDRLFGSVYLTPEELAQHVRMA